MAEGNINSIRAFINDIDDEDVLEQIDQLIEERRKVLVDGQKNTD
jgi:hypothetical protein